MGLLAPIFLAGFALVAIPYLVHQIRRPERKPVHFSSLMFVPDIRRDVIERRRIQHPLLMLLRMLLLIALALAFTRPYWETPAEAVPVTGDTALHVILLDTSYSMGAAGAFDEARRRALGVLESLRAGDRVGVITFAAAPRIDAPLAGPDTAEAGDIQRARLVLQSARLTHETTRYLPALQAAEAMLNPSAYDADDEDAPRLVVHLISDFQHAGMPDAPPAWKLSPRIELELIEVGAADGANVAITDLAIEELRDSRLRIRGKVKNWSDARRRPIDVRLVVGGETVESRSLEIPLGNASQVMFTLPWDGSSTVEGWLEVDDDALAEDNRHYFAWNARPKRPVLLAAEPGLERTLSAGRFLQLAVPNDSDLPWRIVPTTPDALVGALADERPEIVVISDVRALDAAGADALLQYVADGGDAFVMLDPRDDAARLNALLLDRIGAPSEGTRHETAIEGRFASLDWVDLRHRVFMPFNEARFNDFSGMHVYNHHRLAPATGDTEDAPRVLARFDDGLPAMVEARVGRGRMIVWAFTPDLATSNLPRLRAFVPVLHETLAYLTRAAAPTSGRHVGEIASPPADVESDAWRMQPPGSDAMLAVADTGPVERMLAAPGFLRWRDGDGPWRRIEAVNVDPDEGDPARIPTSEFRIRMSAAAAASAASTAADQPAGSPGNAAQLSVRHEYGYQILFVLLAFLLMETVYATRLSAAARGKSEAEA